MAFVTAKSGGDNPLKALDDNMYVVKFVKFEQVENQFKGQLYKPDKPEGKDNQRNNYDYQWELTLEFEGEENDDGEPLQARVWANPTLGEKSKLRKIVKAAGAWVDGPTDEESGFDDEDIVGRKAKVLVQEGKIDGWLKAS